MRRMHGWGIVLVGALLFLSGILVYLVLWILIPREEAPPSGERV